MILKGISMVLIYVSDVAESVKWYQETLELPVLDQVQGFASLGIGKQRLGLHAGEVAGASEARTIPVFEVDDFPETKAELESRGCEFYFEN